MAIDVRGYAYFIERRASDKRWVATVTEFPDLVAESRIRNRAINDLQDLVAAEVLRRRRSGEEVPSPPLTPTSSLLKAFGLD